MLPVDIERHRRDHGREAVEALTAARTVTFAALKPGLVLEPGRSKAGRVVVADIGLDVARAAAAVVEADDVAEWLPPRPASAHKWSASVLLIAGSAGMTGAGHLVAAAAQRAGAGMVRLGSPGVADDPARPTEAVGLELPSVGWAGAVWPPPPGSRRSSSAPGSVPRRPPSRPSSTCWPPPTVRRWSTATVSPPWAAMSFGS